jgi:PEP-CTERM motif
MTRVSVPPMTKIAVLSFVAVLLMAAPARADLITLNFTGSVDLTSLGGAVYPYSGFFTWNTATSPFESGPNEADYALAGYNLVFNGTNVTMPLSSDGDGNGLIVFNDANPLGTGNLDALAFFAFAGNPLPGGDLFLVGALAGPTTMFGSTALPGNLNFLSQANNRFTVFIFEPDGEDEFLLQPQGTLNITGSQVTPSAVPEPTTLLLLGTGLAGAGIRRWRRSRINR